MAELILALDVATGSEAARLLDRLPGLRWVKVGSILMTAEGPSLVRALVARGLQVFLDLKWHDIPQTVAGAVHAAAGLGVHMATVHAAGGDAMLTAAAQAAPAGMALVGVTVLTSQETVAPAAGGAPGGSLGDAVERLARLAVGSGLSGVVCSPLETARVRGALGPEALIVVPGIRRPGDPADDQRRTAAPADAVRLGATHLVVGRPILKARDPASALREFLDALS